MGTSADVRVGVGGCVWGWVAEEAEDGAGCSLGCVVRRGEEVVDLRDVVRSAQTTYSLWGGLHQGLDQVGKGVSGTDYDKSPQKH